MIWFRFFWWMLVRGAVSGALLGSAFGTLLIPVLGTIFGFIYGAIMGVVVGIVNGIALVILTVLWFSPPQASVRFQRWASGVVVVCTVAAGLWALLQLTVGATAIILIPVMIAAVAMGYFAWCFPTYAVRAFAEKDIGAELYGENAKNYR